MGRPVVMRYHVDPQRATKALTAVIARLGYTIKTADKDNGLVTFETGMSMFSWAGQSLSAHVFEVGGTVNITIGGTMKSHGAQIQLYDWGESAKIARKVFEQLDSMLGPGKLISGSRPIPGGTAIAVVVIAVFVIVVLWGLREVKSILDLLF